MINPIETVMSYDPKPPTAGEFIFFVFAVLAITLCLLKCADKDNTPELPQVSPEVHLHLLKNQ